MVAIVNCVPFHLEVLVGVVALVKELDYDLQLFTYRSNDPMWGPRGLDATAELHKRYGSFPVFPCAALARSPDTLPDAVFLVSGQEDGRDRRRLLLLEAISRGQPLVSIIHNSDRITHTRALLHLRISTVLLGLSPTVHRKLAALHPDLPPDNLNWLLPILPMANGTACLAAGRTCKATFTIQGTVDPARRNLTTLYDALAAHHEALLAARISVKLVGSNFMPFVMPSNIPGIIFTHFNYNFSQYFREVEASLALLPLTTNPRYLDGTKITSTVVTSLITGVPILADRAFLQAYPFLTEDAVYLQHADEDIAAAMLRVAAMDMQAHLKVRSDLQAARLRLHQHNLQVLRHYVQ